MRKDAGKFEYPRSSGQKAGNKWVHFREPATTQIYKIGLLCTSLRRKELLDLGDWSLFPVLS